MDQYESSVKNIPYAQARVFAKLENLENLEVIKDKISTDKIQDFRYSRDDVSATISPLGNVTIRVVEREEPKCIKFEVAGSPFPTNMWIQIIPDGDNASKMRIVVKTELNFMIRSMVEAPLKDGIEKIATILASVEY